jgi:hypothetical protein
MSCETPYCYVGTAQPEYVTLQIADDTGVDLTTVTAVNLMVTRGDATTSTWACDIVSKTKKLIVVSHTFAADGSDVPVVDTLSLAPIMTVSAGFIHGDPVLFEVRSLVASRD